MSLEAILTVIAVILAVLALIPRERGEDLRIRLGGGVAAVITLAAGLILYWSLLEPLHSLPLLGRLPRFIPWLAGWDTGSSSLVMFLLVTGYACWAYRRRIPVGRLPKVATALSNALARRRFDECAHLLQAHLGPIHDALDGRYWQLKLRKHLLPTVAELHMKALAATRDAVSRSPRKVTSADLPVAPASAPNELSFQPPREHSALTKWYVSYAERPCDAANDIVRAIGLSPQLVRHIAASNPYLGLRLSQLPSTWVLREVSETFARALLSDPESIFYRELRRAENIDLNGVPMVDRNEQPLLSALCDDSVQRDGAQLLYTYMDAGVDSLGVGTGKLIRVELNGPLGDYYERTRWESPPFATIYLLEITAPRNAVSADAQNLNLYVVSSLVNALLHQLSPSDDVDLSREWPTPTHYLLYACVSLLVDVVNIWRDRPSELPQDKLVERCDGQPCILPAHAINVLSIVMYTILRSHKLDGRFKGYLLEVWWKAYREKYKDPWSNSDTVLQGLVRGEPFGRGDMQHRDGLAEAMEHVDIVTQMSEGGDRLRAAFELPPT